MKPNRQTFLGRYGNADHITSLIHSGNFTSPEMADVMNQNPQFNKRHLAALFDKEVPMRTHIRNDPMMVSIANHPLTHKTQLQKLVDPHRGYPFQGSPQHLWPDHAKIAKRRLDDHDEDEE